VVMDSLLAALPVLIAGLFMGLIARRREHVRMTHILAAGLILITGFRTHITGFRSDEPLWFVFLTAGLGSVLVGLAVRPVRLGLDELPEGRVLELLALLSNEGREAAVSRAMELTGANREQAGIYIDDLNSRYR
jgi:hypothetical protein